jgi:hypothetical protein
MEGVVSRPRSLSQYHIVGLCATNKRFFLNSTIFSLFFTNITRSEFFSKVRLHRPNRGRSAKRWPISSSAWQLYSENKLVGRSIADRSPMHRPGQGTADRSRWACMHVLHAYTILMWTGAVRNAW